MRRPLRPVRLGLPRHEKAPVRLHEVRVPAVVQAGKGKARVDKAEVVDPVDPAVPGPFRSRPDRRLP